MKIKNVTLGVALLLTQFLWAQRAVVEHEHIRSGWKFDKIVRASKTDAATDSKVTTSGNRPIASCLPADALHSGIMPQECRLLRDFFCFTNENADGGKIVMDLGQVKPVAMINSYSAHGPVGGTTWCEEFDGSRAPQVYTLYASAQEHADPTNLNSQDWVKIADVDTRPKGEKDDWVGQYGVNVKGENGALLGNYRWIVWDVKSTLKPGADNPKWTDTWYTELDVHTPQTLANAGDAIAAGSQLEEIIIVFKSHFDIGFTHTAPDVVNVYRTDMIDQALKTIEESENMPAEKRFSWTIPSWVAYQILWDGQDPVRRAKVEKAIKNGRLVVHGLPVTTHTESMELEDMIFGLSLNKKIAQDAGVPMSRSGKMTDVPSHSWILPTLMKNSGMDFLHIGVNPVNERPDLPMLYNWEGPDGSKLLTMHPQGYGSDPEFGHGLYPPKNWQFRHWLAMIVATDNAGPPRAAEVEALLKQAEATMPGVKVRFGTMEDFADAIFAEERAGAVVPVVKADMPDCWIHGVGTMPTKMSEAQRTRPQIAATKLLDASLRMWGIEREDISRELFTAQERSMMYSEHTYGGNRNLEGRKAYGIDDFEHFIKTDKAAIYLENTWKDHSDYIDSAKKVNDLLLGKAMAQLAESVAVKGDRIVVFNPLPYKRDAIVEIPQSSGKKFLAKDIPAGGYKTYSTSAVLKNSTKQQDAKSIENTVIENKTLRITIDRKRGGVVSVINKADGRELVDQTAPYAFGQYLYEKFDSVQVLNYHLGCSHLNTVYGYNGRGCKGWNIRADLPGKPEYRKAVAEYDQMLVSKTATGTEVVLKASPKGIIESDVTTTISLPDDFGWFEVTVALDNKKPDYWPEAGAIYMPVKADNPQFRLGRLGAVVDPVKDFAQGSNRTYGVVNTGAMVAGGNGKGLAIVPLDHGMMSFGDKGVCTIDPDYIPTTPVAMVSMFNTVWTINFPYWIYGQLSSTVRVWATDNFEPSSLVDGSAEARNAVVVARADGQGGKLPKSAEGISVIGNGVRLLSMERYEQGDIIRFWEQAGKGGAVKVKLPKGSGYTKATPVDLRGQRKGESLTVVDDGFGFELGSYAPAAYLLEK